MFKIRKILPDEIPIYKKLYSKKNGHLLSIGVYPELDNASEGCIESWAIADSDRICGFFQTTLTDEFDLSESILICNFLFCGTDDIQKTNKPLVKFLNGNFNTKKIYFRIENFLKQEYKFIEGMGSKVYSSATMLNNKLPAVNSASNDVLIRSVRKNKDEEIFSVLYFDSFKEISSALTLEKIKKWTDSWFSSPAFDPELYLLAEVKNDVVGFIAVELCNKEMGIGHLYEIGVKKEYRGAGISQMLFQRCTAIAKAKGIKQLLVRVRKSNRRAYRFFTNVGFKNLYERQYFKL